MIRSDPISACKRGLEAATQACAMDCGDNRDAQPLDGVEEHLAIATQSLRICRRLQFLKLFDVSTGDPSVGLAADEHCCVHCGVALEPRHERNEFVLHRAIQLVHRFVRQVERDDRDSVADFNRQRRVVSRSHESADGGLSGAHRVLSTTIAKPLPPAEQTVIRPNCPLRRRNSFSNVVVMRAPVAPNGCPIAIEPPITLSFALSTSPTGCENPARSAHPFDSNPLRFDSTCAANASCISIRSMSFSESPARLSATGAASTGAWSSCSPGSRAAYGEDRMIPG